MPTHNPRLTITLSPAVDAAVRAVCDATGQSKSSLIGELLEQARPVLERMATIIVTAKTATEEAKARMAANLEEAQTKLESHLGIVNELWEEQTADLLGDIEAIGRRKAKASKGGGSPRPPARTQADGRTGRNAVSGAGSSTAIAKRPPRLTGGSGTPRKPTKTTTKSPAKPSQARGGR